MSDVKISQLNSDTTIGDSDLLPFSKSLGGGQWESKSITGSNLSGSLTSTRILTVNKSGIRDADTIKDAIDLAVALSPTQANPVVIKVMPGSYAEDNPISVPEWVSIYAEGKYYGAIIVASNDGNIFVGNGNSTIERLTIVGSVAFSNTAYISTTTTTGVITNCALINCRQGIVSDGGSINASFIIGTSVVGGLDTLLRAIDGGYILGTSCVSTGGTNGFCSCGSGSELYLYSCQAEDCINGLYADDDGYIDAFSNRFEDCTNGIHIGSTGSSQVKAVGCVIEDSVTNDIYIESATARLAYIGHIDSSKFSIISGATVDIVADDENFGGGLVVGKASLQGKVAIGTPGAIILEEDMQLNVGEGNAFELDKQGNPIVEYWSCDDSAASGSKFTRFANNAGTQRTGANDAIIVGCKYPFPAIRINIITPLTTANYLTTEYWNGSTWVDLTARLEGGGVAGYKRLDFTRRKNQIFRNTELQFVEMSSELFSNGDWAAANNVLDEIPSWDAGESFYAVRFRNNGPLTSGMVFDDGKVKPHSFMISTSGRKANFGVYRTSKIYVIDSKGFYADPTTPPAYVTLPMSTHITYANNPTFLKTNVESKISVAFIIPDDIDTASPLQCYVDGVVTANDPDKDIYTTMYRAYIDSTDPAAPVGSLPEVEVEQLTTVTEGANTFISVVQDFDISGMSPGDQLLIAVSRFATDPADTYSGDFILGNVTFKYKAKFV